MDAGISYRVTGKVQGVGFRYFVSSTAQNLGLTGWVKNHTDGSVIGVAEGDHGLLNSFADELKIGSRWSQVASVEKHSQVFSGEYKIFEIRY